MAIKPTGYPPLPHHHTISQVDGLTTELEQWQVHVAGEVGRDYRPMCRAVYNGTFTLPNATDVFMGGGFQTLHDNANMLWHPGNNSGGDNTKLRVSIPISGFYRVSWKYYVDLVGTSAPSASVLTSNVNVTANSIINSQGAANSWSSPHAYDVVYLTAGTRLYFVAWQGSGANKTFYGTWFGGSRSNIWVEWVGR